MIRYTVTKEDLDIIHTALTALLERERSLQGIVDTLEKQIKELKDEPKSVVHNHYHYEGPFKYPDNPVYPPYPGYPTYPSLDMWCKTSTKVKTANE